MCTVFARSHALTTAYLQSASAPCVETVLYQIRNLQKPSKNQHFIIYNVSKKSYNKKDIMYQSVLLSKIQRRELILWKK